MASIVKPILVGGGWGLGLGAAAAAVAVAAPALRPLLRRAVRNYLETSGRIRQRALESTAPLQEIYEETTRQGKNKD